MAVIDSEEMSVSIDTTPSVTTVDDTARAPGGRAVASAADPASGLGLFEKEMYTLTPS
ncbi:hypothetical protein GCM10007269_18300 [Microbacterium murale]|uniref:Uncharacterized protein n=1 Tax=Microbacterium murale TaxID=1081040 RepID=A0ABQ1RP00_9MICO|nr:hypothetical protein GCM10007269_18300 [Microbacterium murale]